MVAIHIPRQAGDEWGGGRPGAAEGRAPTLRPVPVRDRLAHLPDRATRLRRRRLAVLVAAVSVCGAAALGLQALAGLADVGGTSGPEPLDVRPAPLAGQLYVVQSGDTLWSIAEQIAPNDDPRPVVDALREANGGPVLEVGTTLTLNAE